MVLADGTFFDGMFMYSRRRVWLARIPCIPELLQKGHDRWQSSYMIVMPVGEDDIRNIWLSYINRVLKSRRQNRNV